MARRTPLEGTRLAAFFVAAPLLVVLAPRALASDVSSGTTLQPAAPDTTMPAPEGTLVVRRALNPNYRPPASRVPAAHFVAPRQNGFDHFYAQVSGRGLGADVTTGDARFILERMFKDTDRATLHVDGAARSGLWSGREVRLETRRGRWAGDLGDLIAFAPFPEMNFHAVRGLFVARALPEGGALAVSAGQPSPWASGDGAKFVALTGQNIASETTRIKTAAAGYRWDRGPQAGSSAWEAALAEHTPLWGGMFGTGFGFQRHDLGPGATSAAAIGAEYRTLHPMYALSFRVRRATEGMRVLTDEEADLAPRQEASADGQTRFWRGRAELHSSLTRFVGGDSTRNWQSAQVGGSSQFGPSPWYAGGHASWDRPGTSNERVRQVGAYVGRNGGATPPMLLRLLQTTTEGSPAAWELSGETSVGLGPSSRLSIEPLAEWRSEVLDRAGVTLGGSHPLPWAGSHVTLRLRVESERIRDYRVGVTEASVAFTFRPRPRDTWEMELRQGLDVQGYELTSTYDLQQPRYDGGSSVARRRGASDVVVRIERTDGTGAEGVLVSLDGKDMRFTDSLGEAVFEGVVPGTHQMTVEERTLPDGWHVNGPLRQLITVEKSLSPPVMHFQIARLERRSKF